MTPPNDPISTGTEAAFSKQKMLGSRFDFAMKTNFLKADPYKIIPSKHQLSIKIILDKIFPIISVSHPFLNASTCSTLLKAVAESHRTYQKAGGVLVTASAQSVSSGAYLPFPCKGAAALDVPWVVLDGAEH